jgi:MOSC domain-containing protein YiiM
MGPVSFVGEVVEIHVAPAGGAPMERVDAVQAVDGRGLAGDRYGVDAGTYSEKVTPGRQVTLIEAEALAAVAAESGIVLAPGATRRNITTRGVPLNHLVGREFTVGRARLRGVKLCEPCGYLQRLLGIDGLVGAFAHRAGLNAEVLSGGDIRVGDPIEPG